MHNRQDLKEATTYLSQLSHIFVFVVVVVFVFVCYSLVNNILSFSFIIFTFFSVSLCVCIICIYCSDIFQAYCQCLYNIHNMNMLLLLFFILSQLISFVFTSTGLFMSLFPKENILSIHT